MREVTPCPCVMRTEKNQRIWVWCLFHFKLFILLHYLRPSQFAPPAQSSSFVGSATKTQQQTSDTTSDTPPTKLILISTYPTTAPQSYDMYCGS